MGKRIYLILLLSTLAWADRCDPPAEISQFLAALPEDNSARHKAIGERLKSSAEDFWLNRLFLDGSVYERTEIREQYWLRYEGDRSSENEYLYGRSLVGFDTKRALEVYSDILKKDPDNPWVHNSQLEIYRSPAFKNRPKLRASFDAVTRACPLWVEPYKYLTDLDDDAMAPHAARLRTILEGSKSPWELRSFSTLWSAEFRLKSADEKARVEADVWRLWKTGGTDATIAAGARLIGDNTLANLAAPPPKVDITREQNAWQRTHPYPKPDDPPEKKKAYAEARLEAANQWIAKAPTEIVGYADRLGALQELDAPAVQIESATEDLLRIARVVGRGGGASFIEGVARTYLDRGIQLDRVPALIEEALKIFDDPEEVMEIDLAPSPEMTAELRMNVP